MGAPLRSGRFRSQPALSRGAVACSSKVLDVDDHPAHHHPAGDRHQHLPRRGQGLRAQAPPHGERAITVPRPHPQASASIASSRLSSLLPGTSLAPGGGPCQRRGLRQRAWAAPCGDALRLSACTVGLRHGHTKKRYDLRLTSSASVRSRSPPFKQMSNCAKASSSVGLRWPAIQRGLTGRWTTGLGSVDTSASV